MNVANKIIVITGGSEGLGKALAKILTSLDAKVIIASNDVPGLAVASKELEVETFETNVRSYEQVEKLHKHVIDTHERIDAWINNAGIQIAPSPIEKIAPEKLTRLFEVNFFGYFYGCQVAIPTMRAQDSGMIVNINSTAGLEGKAGLSAYVSSKYAVKGLTETARVELADTNVTVVQVHPGGIKTDIYKEQYPDDLDEYMDVFYAAEQIVQNLLSEDPEVDHIIRRPKK